MDSWYIYNKCLNPFEIWRKNTSVKTILTSSLQFETKYKRYIEFSSYASFCVFHNIPSYEIIDYKDKNNQF